MDTTPSQKSKKLAPQAPPSGFQVPSYVTLTGDQFKSMEAFPDLIKNICKVAQDCMKYTGQAVLIVPRPHEGFADFSLVSVRLKDGVIEHIEEVSDPLCGLETQARMEIKQAKLLEKLRKNYPPGHQYV